MVKIKLKVGDKAPLFKLDSYNAGTIDLGELIGKQKIVLIFSRYFGCPICQLDLNILMESVPEINNKGAKLLYVTQSGEKVTQEFIAKYKIEFPVIASSKKELYAEYGLGLMNEEAVKKVKSKFKEATERGFVHGDYEGWENQGPGQFVIGEDGNIIHERKGWLLLPEIFAVL
ncbi:MAG: AhpC/TSA family protein [Candidatus Lokiarchaeota archaeon]|nr:AhpC/TSA family protein [Candidatus Lokiarchaeota archaeon]